MAGHSRWTQIKHKKSISDAKKGQLFSKLIREISVAAREAGANPTVNPRLRSAMERARSAGLPKDNIERAIERASGKGEGGEFTEFLYEAAAPGGIAILIEGITDNKNRTLAEIKRLLSERGGRLAEPGSLTWNFEKIGLLECRAGDNPGKTREETELAIIESGASDFRTIDDVWLVETAFADGEQVRRGLESRGIAVKELTRDYKPQTSIAIGPAERAAIEALLDELTDHPDVQEVYTNLKE